MIETIDYVNKHHPCMTGELYVCCNAMSLGSMCTRSHSMEVCVFFAHKNFFFADGMLAPRCNHSDGDSAIAETGRSLRLSVYFYIEQFRRKVTQFGSGWCFFPVACNSAWGHVWTQLSFHFWGFIALLLTLDITHTRRYLNKVVFISSWKPLTGVIAH